MVLKSVTAILWDCVTDFLFFIQDCKSMKKAVIITILCTAFASCIYNPESLNVIPVPQQIDINPIGTFYFDEETQLYIDAPEPDRQVLLDYISTSSIASSPPREQASSMVFRPSYSYMLRVMRYPYAPLLMSPVLPIVV